MKRLRESQPDYAKACDEGIEWKVFRHECVNAFPWISNLCRGSRQCGTTDRALRVPIEPDVQDRIHCEPFG
eukprot:6141052-Pyramimonas_sp.AAC.1